ncbi:MAG: hypothetical protein QOH93_1110 [Chloroflexia bacterium]|jgi:hypothetical protein|nr:hypothetical protein [Chloroflexia bacterium]
MSEVAVSGVLGKAEPGTIRPYNPSFVDRITDWVRRLPAPSWIFYAAIGLALIVLSSATKWIDGSLPVGGVTWLIFLGASTFPYALGLLHYLDNSAAEALADFRPAMDIDDRQYAELKYRYTTLPARPALIAAVIGALYGVAYPLTDSPETLAATGFFSSVPATVLQLVELALSYGTAFMLIYHSIRQLRMVSRTYASYARVDLFNLRPMHSLSRLAARTAIGLAIPSYAWGFVNVSPENGAVTVSAASIFELVMFSALVVILFVWPLVGARRLLRQAKAAAVTEAQQQFKATIAELHRRRENGEFEGMGGVNEALDGLLKEQTVLSKISTWPWQSDTFRAVASAILLPIVVWAITRILENVWTF